MPANTTTTATSPCDDDQGTPGSAAAEPALARATVTILYGTETGNAQQVAELAARRAQAMGLNVRPIDMADYKTRELRHERLIMIVTATHGEGHPPEPAMSFYEFLHGRKAPPLDHIRFAVLALGDSSYEFFCQTGKDFDARLEALGGQRLCDRVDCDVDFDETAEAWTERALSRFAELIETEPELQQVAAQFEPVTPIAADDAPAYNRKNPFMAEVLENVQLTGRGSGKQTYHLEFSLAGSGLHFEPGDILCVAPQNRSDVVEALLDATGFDGDGFVQTPAGPVPLAQALRCDYEITTLTPPFLSAYAARANHDALTALLAESNKQQLNEYTWGRHVIDVIEDFPIPGLEAEEFIAMLRRLPAREYSIASSFNANPDEVHLTVAAVRYHSHARDRHGVASTYLADFATPGTTVPVYLKRNKTFKLPEDPSRPIIMIGPGTGVAPFRAFMQERECEGTTGGNWLFFGEQHFRTDFLYQTEWQDWLKQGVLSRIDLAFSRDQAQKIYVQHRMLERGRALYEWLEEGAYVYVCGDAERMAPDVQQALETILQQQAGLSPEGAAEYIKELQREKRYQRDVY